MRAGSRSCAELRPGQEGWPFSLRQGCLGVNHSRGVTGASPEAYPFPLAQAALGPGWVGLWQPPPPGAFRCDARSSLSTSLYKSVHLGLLPAWLRTLLGKRVREVGPQKQVPHLTSPRATNAPDSSALWVTTCYDLVHGWLPGGSQSSRTWPCPGQIARGCTPKMHPTGELPPGLSILPTFPAPPLAAGRATLLASLEKCEQCSLSPGSPTSPPPAPAEKGAGPWHWLLPLPSTPTHLPSFGVSGSPGSLGSSLITALVALRTPGLCLHLFSSSPVPPPHFLPCPAREADQGSNWALA